MGFEPTIPCGIPVFETGALGHYATLPSWLFYLKNNGTLSGLGYNVSMPQDLRSVVRNFDRAQEEEQTALYAAGHSLPYINLVNYPFIGDVLGLIPEEIATQFEIVAFLKSGTTVRVATVDPFKAGLAEAMTQLGQAAQLQFQPFVCSPTSLAYALGRYPLLVPKKVAKTVAPTAEVGFATLNDLKSAIARVSTTELLETLIAGAVSLNASDVHFEPGRDNIQVRFRIDGKLLPIIELPEKAYKLLSSRIMTGARIKLDLKTIAQDGRMTMTVNDAPLDIRVNALPSAYGQTIELRLLNYRQFLTMEQLELNEATKAAITQRITRPEGLVLFTGPTGSGKTTSLYAVLQLLNTAERKIITIEDPIEYRLEGIEQVQVDPAAGFDFPQALRAVLRQDPNVIMVGEIRDQETAEIAVNAALTGHLVLSTLHTNSAAAAFSRLLQMQVPKYLLADAVSLIVAQRLVRKLCEVCRGSGCETCHNTGYHGRILIAEHFAPDLQVVELIKREATLGEFQQYFASTGNTSLLQDGLAKVAQGITTEEEIRSVTA